MIARRKHQQTTVSSFRWRTIPALFASIFGALLLAVGGIHFFEVMLGEISNQASTGNIAKALGLTLIYITVVVAACLAFFSAWLCMCGDFELSAWVFFVGIPICLFYMWFFFVG